MEVRLAAAARDADVRGALLRLCTAAARQERELSLQRLQASAPRLGCLGVRRRGIEVQEVRAFLFLKKWGSVRKAARGQGLKVRHGSPAMPSACVRRASTAAQVPPRCCIAIPAPDTLAPCLPASPHSSCQVWEDGQAFKDVKLKLRTLAEAREGVEAARKAAKKRLPLPGQALPAAGGEAGALLHPDDWVVQVGPRGGAGLLVGVGDAQRAARARGEQRPTPCRTFQFAPHDPAALRVPVSSRRRRFSRHGWRR